uniref:Cytochrome b n=1 Tax=Calisoga longitarsis TaxID=394809 RepID=B2CKV5_9ARAC|nr:cytochrome b [Calisoga longitarsis]
MKEVIRSSDMVLNMMSDFLIDLPLPSSISYAWNFGSLLGLYLVVQIVTGLFLSLHFSGEVLVSFSSVIHIMRDVNSGWFIRVVHSNGASMFFLFLYLHVGRGIYYGSYVFMKVWMSGVSILLLSMATAFLGYVLPWGQMSFWAATVITNLLSAIPYVGVTLVEWVWGGFAVSNPTLIRFFSFHFILPFVILVVVVGHLVFLHETGSSNPVGGDVVEDSIPFHPMFSFSDIVGMIMAIFVLIIVSLLYPYVFMDGENFIPSNPLVTPVHIQPEWYFLFAYTILRSNASKMGGVVALFMSVFILYFFPLVYKKVLQSSSYYVIGSVVYWILVVTWVLLTWIGAREVEEPFSMLGGLLSVMYFFLFFVLWLVYKVQDFVLD